MTWITRDEAAKLLDCHPQSVNRAVLSAPFDIPYRDPGRGKGGRHLPREYWAPGIERLVESYKNRPRTNIGRKACTEKSISGRARTVKRLWPHGGNGRGLMGEP